MGTRRAKEHKRKGRHIREASNGIIGAEKFS
jgi:hypothetical protein